MPSLAVADLRTALRTEVTDLSSSAFASNNTTLDGIINRALRIMSRDTEHLRIAKGFLHTANVPQITFTHNLVRVYKAWWEDQEIGVEHVTGGSSLKQYMGGSVSSRPRYIMPFEDQHHLIMHPRPESGPGSTTLGAAIASAATQDITVAALSAFEQDFGRAIIDPDAATAEEIEFHGTNTTTVKLLGCTRGHGLTVARASHANGTTIKYAHLVVYASYIHPNIGSVAWRFPDDFLDLFIVKAAEIAHRIRRRLQEARVYKGEYDDMVGQYKHRAEWLANEGWWPRNEGSLYDEHE